MRYSEDLNLKGLESGLDVTSLGDKDQWGLSYHLHQKESCAPTRAERNFGLFAAARLFRKTCQFRIRWIDISEQKKNIFLFFPILCAIQPYLITCLVPTPSYIDFANENTRWIPYMLHRLKREMFHGLSYRQYMQEIWCFAKFASHTW